MPGMTIEEGINQVYNGVSHVVILGAGASIAATIRNPEKNGLQLPSMDNFVDKLKLHDILDEVPDNLKADNFEKLYSNLHNDNPESDLIRSLEKRILEYFNSMDLPEEPTIYDYMIMGLRNKDLIATFNWDPFLYKAYVRNKSFVDDCPHLAFLHGNVAIGFGKESRRCGAAGMIWKENGEYFEPTKLLYPIENKNYTDDEFISIEWDRTKAWLEKENKTVRTTIYGYGAPASDVEAVSLLNKAWGTPDERDMEQFEVIDVVKEKELRERWKGFIHSHHYNVTDDYFKSSLGLNPRRTCESYCSHFQPLTPREMFRSNNPVPQDFKTLQELWDWHKPLIEAEQINAVKEQE